MEAKTRAKLRNLLRILLFISSLVILFFLLKGIGFDKVAEVFVKVGVGGMLILIACEILENGSDALALYYTLPEKKNFLQIFPSNCLGALINQIIPWEVGELVKIGLIKEVTGSENSIKSVVLWNYIYKLSKGCALFSVVLLSLLVYAFVDDPYFKMNTFLIVALCAILGYLPYLGMMILLKLNISEKVAKILKYLGKKNPDEFIEKAKKMDRDLNLFRKERPSDYRKVFWIQFFARLVALFSYFLCIRFAGFDNYPAPTIMLAFCAVKLGNYILAFIPMKLGVGEGIGYVIFNFVGFSGADGGLITFIARIKTLIAMGIVSSLILFKPKEKK